ncbi:hypothetical protein Tco_0857241 [Tanacetum coccineum]|uniref:Uncharacterized protein n=1 Tax=Tanacetum coccineum TaxID=301880 RepID=A0ABQ5AEE1_9ASTR
MVGRDSGVWILRRIRLCIESRVVFDGDCAAQKSNSRSRSISRCIATSTKHQQGSSRLLSDSKLEKLVTDHDTLGLRQDIVARRHQGIDACIGEDSATQDSLISRARTHAPYGENKLERFVLCLSATRVKLESEDASAATGNRSLPQFFQRDHAQAHYGKNEDCGSVTSTASSIDTIVERFCADCMAVVRMRWGDDMGLCVLESDSSLKSNPMMSDILVNMLGRSGLVLVVISWRTVATLRRQPAYNERWRDSVCSVGYEEVALGTDGRSWTCGEYSVRTGIGGTECDSGLPLRWTDIRWTTASLASGEFSRALSESGERGRDLRISSGKETEMQELWQCGWESLPSCGGQDSKITSGGCERSSNLNIDMSENERSAHNTLWNDTHGGEGTYEGIGLTCITQNTVERGRTVDEESIVTDVEPVHIESVAYNQTIDRVAAKTTGQTGENTNTDVKIYGVLGRKVLMGQSQWSEMNERARTENTGSQCGWKPTVKREYQLEKKKDWEHAFLSEETHEDSAPTTTHGGLTPYTHTLVTFGGTMPTFLRQTSDDLKILTKRRASADDTTVFISLSPTNREISSLDMRYNHLTHSMYEKHRQDYVSPSADC